MATQDDEFLKSLLAAFAIEAADHTQALSDLLLRLENADGAGEPSLVEEIYREAHSLKGAARAVNLLSVENVCQALETVFSAWKKGQLTPTPTLFDALHQGVDAVTSILDAPDDETLAVNAIIERITVLGRGAQADAAPDSAAATPLSASLAASSLFSYGDAPTPITPSGLPPNVTSTGYHSDDAPPPLSPYVPLSPLSFLVSEEPPAPPPTAPQPATPEPVTSELPTPLTPAPNGQVPPLAPTPPTPPRAAPVGTEETVRVATSRLDGMLLQAEEMLLVKQSTLERATELRRIAAQFGTWSKEWNKISPEFRAAGGEDAVVQSTASARRLLDFLEWNRGYVQALEAQITALARVTETDRRATTGLVDNLLEDAKKLLMLPFSHLMGIFPKLVRDLARHQEKDVTFEMQGSEVQIDKRILEKLKDPLIHLLRNSVDHGIETADERARTAKPATATVALRVRQKSAGEVEVQVGDDGRGINTAAVKASALKNGLLSPERAAALSEAEVFDLIFQSSLSTSPIITEISGRGLGMAIVREKVEKLGGSIAVESVLGVGTTFRITLPLTLATFRGVLVEVRGQTFVLPATEVERVVRVPVADVRRVHNRDTITLPRIDRKEGEGHHAARDRDVLPFVPLAEVPELHRGAADSRPRKDLKLAVVLGGGAARVAFEVDAVLAEQEVLVKPFSRPLLRVRNIAGATILASGKAAPILNVSDLLASSLRYVSRGGASQGISPLASSSQLVFNELGADGSALQKSILVAEDSITSRMLLKNILESAGYQVTTAVDGLDALTTLRGGQFDLIVSDVDMPHLNGLDFTAKVREDARFGELPVVLVTARSTREDRERGIDVGANAYIVKSSFNQNDLLEVVQRLI